MVDFLLSLARHVSSWRYKSVFPYALAALGLLLVLYVPLPEGLVIPITIRLIISIIVASMLIILGLLFQSPPQNKPNHIGIIFAIKSENGELRQRVCSDIIREATEILTNLDAEQLFNVIVPSNELAELVTDTQSADLLRRKSKAHMVIFGEAKQRKERGHLFHVLQLQGLVSHLPIPIEVSKSLAEEMNNVMPMRLMIDVENEITGFEISSVQLALSIKYVIASAALLSHDGHLAVRLLEEIQANKGQLRKFGNLGPIRQLSHQVSKRLSDSYNFMSWLSFHRWESSRDEDCLKEAIAWIEKDEQGKKVHSLAYMTLKSVEEFVIKKKPALAKVWIRQCQAKYMMKPEWRYSAAFLSACEGHLDEAKDYYDSAMLLEGGHAVPFQVEGFIAWHLENNPNCNELNFCLGYINEKFKGDSNSAIIYYDRYLGSVIGEAKTSHHAIEHARKFISAHRKNQL